MPKSRHIFFQRAKKTPQNIFSKLSQALNPKGQLISKAIYGQLISPKKRMDKFVLFAFFTLRGKQIKFVRSFFGRINGSPICFLILSDL
jgi:allantoicase